MSSHSQVPAECTIPLPTALMRAAHQLRFMHNQGLMVEKIIGNSSRPSPRSADWLENLQALDHLVQSLEGLAAFLEDLAISVDPDLTADVAGAAKRIAMRDLALALTLGASLPPTHRQKGDVAFFD